MDALYLEDSAGARTQLWPKTSKFPDGLVQETRTYRLEALGIHSPRHTRMFMGEQELESLMPRSENSCLWKWQPGFHAGSIEARIVEPDSRSTSISLVTDPSLNKLSRNNFSVMLHEIMEDSFALFSLGQFKTMLGSDRKNRPIEIARLEYMEQRIDLLENVLAQINHRPKMTLHGSTRKVRLGESQRISGNDILKSYRTGNLVNISSKRLAIPATKGRLYPRSIRVEKTLHLSETKENCEIKHCLKRWQQWLARIDSGLLKIIRSLEAQSGSSDLESSHHIWRRKIQKMKRKLRRMDQLEFIADIRASKNAPKFSSVYQRDPSYRKFFKIYREFNWGLSRVYGDFLNIPLARTFDLYEIWCFYRILRICIKRYGVSDEQLAKVFDPNTSKRDIIVRSGVIELELQNGFILGFKKQFREYWLEAEGIGSFSRTMEPDIYLSIPSSTSQSRNIIVLDAKYRINTNLNSAIASIHMYRDSIVRESNSGIDRQVIGAYLLSPHVPTGSADWKQNPAPTRFAVKESNSGINKQVIGEYPLSSHPPAEDANWKATPAPARFFHPEYRHSFKFGALTLTPGMNLRDIDNAIGQIVRESSSY